MARGPDEDLEAIRIFGHGLYGFDPKQLAELKTREDLAALGLRMALRDGHTVILDHNGAVAGASRITPSPWGTKDPETGEIEHWETVAIRPEHQGHGLSTPLREAALATSPAVVIKSRIKHGNPKSWSVAEKMGFKHVDDDGCERIYEMRRPERALQHRGPHIRSAPAMKKTAAASARIDDALTVLVKTAGVLNDVSRFAVNNRDALIGGGAGALLGAGAGMLTNKKNDKHKWLAPVLLGLGGGAAGAGIGHVSDRLAGAERDVSSLGQDVDGTSNALIKLLDKISPKKRTPGMIDSSEEVPDQSFMQRYSPHSGPAHYDFYYTANGRFRE
jgi:RimJ/RimL family protein N-acetyltransferase